MATYEPEPEPARELTIPETADALHVAALRAAKAAETFLQARGEWREARSALSETWAGYIAAKDRQDDPEVARPAY